jgi:hypothetical protein
VLPPGAITLQDNEERSRPAGAATAASYTGATATGRAGRAACR